MLKTANFICSTHQRKSVVEQKMFGGLKLLLGMWCSWVKSFWSKSVLYKAWQGRVKTIKRIRFNFHTIIYKRKNVFYRNFYYLQYFVQILRYKEQITCIRSSDTFKLKKNCTHSPLPLYV